jgi:hypothetical protein
MMWCECIARFIDELQQQLWRILCGFEQSQGLYPKHTIKLLISQQFLYHILIFLMQEGIKGYPYAIYDAE